MSLLQANKNINLGYRVTPSFRVTFALDINLGYRVTPSFRVTFALGQSCFVKKGIGSSFMPQNCHSMDASTCLLQGRTYGKGSVPTTNVSQINLCRLLFKATLKVRLGSCHGVTVVSCPDYFSLSGKIVCLYRFGLKPP